MCAPQHTKALGWTDFSLAIYALPRPKRWDHTRDGGQLRPIWTTGMELTNVPYRTDCYAGLR